MMNVIYSAHGEEHIIGTEEDNEHVTYLGNDYFNKINLSSLNITTFRFTNTLSSNIYRLMMECNLITSLDNINLPNTIQRIYLSGNRITEIKNIPPSCIYLDVYMNPIKKVSQHIPITMCVSGVPWWEGINKNGGSYDIYSPQEISDFTQEYTIYSLLADRKIQCTLDIILSYLSIRNPPRGFYIRNIYDD